MLIICSLFYIFKKKYLMSTNIQKAGHQVRVFQSPVHIILKHKEAIANTRNERKTDFFQRHHKYFSTHPISSAEEELN